MEILSKINKIFKNNYIWEWIILLIIVILLYMDVLVLERIKIFLFILFLFLSYIYIYEKIFSFFIKEKFPNYYKNKYKYEITLKDHDEIEYNKDIKKLKYILRIMIKINKIKNKFNILTYLIEINKILFRFFSKMNCKLKNYKKIRIIIYLIIMSIYLPIYIIVGIYYDFFYKLSKLTIEKLVEKRIIGLIISIIFTSKFVIVMQNFIIGLNINIIYLLLSIYLLLLIISFFLIIIRYYFSYKINKNLSKFISIVGYVLYNLDINIINLKRIQSSIFERFLMWILVVLYTECQWMNKEGRNEINYEDIKEMDLLTYIGHYFHNDDSESQPNTILKKMRWGELTIQKDLYFIFIKKILFDLKKMINFFENKSYLYFFFWECAQKYIVSYLCLYLIQFIIGLNIIYKENKEKKEILLNYYNIIIENIYKYRIFKVWDIEKFYGAIKNSFTVEYNIYINELNYLIFINESYSYLNNKEECLNFFDNYEVYKNIYIKFNICTFDKDKEKITNDFYFICEEDESWDIKFENKEIVFKNKELLTKELNKIIKVWREEWEREWEEKKRDYYT